MQKSFQELLRKQNGDRAIWEYPFAVAGVNITFMLIQMLDLQAGLFPKVVCKSNSCFVYYIILVLVELLKYGISFWHMCHFNSC
jgi:hypothetical protein